MINKSILRSQVPTMKTLLAVIALSGIAALSEAISCYQCVDGSVRYDSPHLDEATRSMMQAMKGQMPRCSESDMVQCDSYMNSCAAIIVSYGGEMGGMSMTTNMVTRSCMMSGSYENTYCDTMKRDLSAQVEMTIQDFSCRVELCDTDYCNTQGMQDQADPQGDTEAVDDSDYGGDYDHYNGSYVSTGFGVTASLVLIATLSAAALFQD